MIDYQYSWRFLFYLILPQGIVNVKLGGGGSKIHCLTGRSLYFLDFLFTFSAMEKVKAPLA
jgi:hypothetical protein